MAYSLDEIAQHLSMQEAGAYIRAKTDADEARARLTEAASLGRLAVAVATQRLHRSERVMRRVTEKTDLAVMAKKGQHDPLQTLPGPTA